MGAIASMLLGTVEMSSVTALTADAAVAADRTFSPDVISPNGVARYEDRSVSVPAARPFVTIGIRKPSNGSRNYKVTVLAGIPTLETLGTSSASGYLPGQKVGYTATCRMEFALPDRCTLAERKAIFAMAASLLSTGVSASDGSPSSTTASPIQAVVQNLESIY